MAVNVEKMVSAALAKVDVPDIARCVEQFSKYKAENHGGVLIVPLPPQFVKEEQESDRPEANEGGNTKKRKKIKKNAMARRIDMAELGEQSFDRICSDTVDSIMVMITDSLKTLLHKLPGNLDDLTRWRGSTANARSLPTHFHPKNPITSYPSSSTMKKMNSLSYVQQYFYRSVANEEK